MATNKIMNHCKRCRKATLHISRSTSHLLHLVLSLVTLGIWTLVWIFLSLLHGAESQCTECGRNRLAPLAALAVIAVAMAILVPTVRHAFSDKSVVSVEKQTGSAQSASAPKPDGTLRWSPNSAPDPDGVVRGEFR